MVSSFLTNEPHCLCPLPPAALPLPYRTNQKGSQLQRVGIRPPCVDTPIRIGLVIVCFFFIFTRAPFSGSVIFGVFHVSAIHHSLHETGWVRFWLADESWEVKLTWNQIATRGKVGLLFPVNTVAVLWLFTTATLNSFFFVRPLVLILIVEFVIFQFLSRGDWTEVGSSLIPGLSLLFEIYWICVIRF